MEGGAGGLARGAVSAAAVDLDIRLRLELVVNCGAFAAGGGGFVYLMNNALLNFQLGLAVELGGDLIEFLNIRVKNYMAILKA